MPNTPDNIITKTPEETARVEKEGYIQSFPGTKEGQKEGKFPFKSGSLVKGRSAKVSADAPKLETESSPSDNIFTPDRSGTSSIRDK